MRVKVMLFAPFRELFAAEEKEIELENKINMQELLDILCDTRQRREQVFEQSGCLRPEVVILQNGQSINKRRGLETELKDGDEIAIIPPVSGG